MQTKKRRNDATTFVLVHGAWAGAWAWKRVVDRLTAKGHQVFAPTLTGLGERSHLAGVGVNLTTHINDVLNEILWKDLRDVVLVGSSYGGLVITGVAEKIWNRLAALVYVDAFLPKDGQSFADITGWYPEESLTPPPPVPKGTYANEADRKWVITKITPQPTATLTERIRITGAYKRVPRKIYIQATGWDGPFDSLVESLRSDTTWNVCELACGHDVGNHEPGALTKILEANTRTERKRSTPTGRKSGAGKGH